MSDPRVHVDTSHTIQESGGAPSMSKLATQTLIDLLDFQWKASLLATSVAVMSPDHGPRHWRDVARVGLHIAKKERIGVEQALSVFCFAAIHDTQRHNDYYDPEHGERAAEVMLKIATDEHILTLGQRRDSLHAALVGHDKGEVDYENDIKAVCWDADRLTLGRVGITPDVQYMSTAYVRREFAHALSKAEAIRTGDDMPWPDIAADYSRLDYL